MGDITETRTKEFAHMIFWLRLVGIDLSPNTKNPNYKYYSAFVIVLIYSFALSIIITAFKIDPKSDLFISTLGCGIPIICGTPRVTTLLYNKDKLRYLLIKLENQTILPDRLKINVSKIEEIREHVFKISVWMSKALVVFATTAMVLFTIVSLIARLTLPKEKWNSPFAIPFRVFDVHCSPNYEIVACYSCISMTYCSFLCSYGDLFVSMITAHIVKHLKTLQHFLRNLHLEKYEDIPPEERVYSYLVDTIKYHLAIFEMVVEIEEAFNLPILFTFVGNVAALAMSLYTLTTVKSVDANYCFAFLFIVFASCEMCLFCYWGNEVFIQSQNLVQAAWEFQWVFNEIRIRKALVLVMARAQKSLALTAGKFSVLSMELFVKIMRLAFSYFTMLNNTKQR